MTDFSALHVALSGLRAAQLAMDVAANNVSNAQTPGYTRQRVDLRARLSRTAPEGQVGLGVEVADVARVRDRFLDLRYRGADSALGSVEVRAELLSRAELVLAEPDAGLTAELNELWDAFEDLSLDPPDRASRIAVINQLDSIASRVNDVSQGLGDLRASALSSLEATLTETNDMLQRVADLNAAILDASARPGTPNDLLDQRDVLLDRLARSVGASFLDEGNGTVRVMIGGISLVAGTEVRELSLDSSTMQILHPSGVAVVAGGDAGGYQQFLTQDLVDLTGRIDQFATDLADALNTVHASGFSPSGPGGDLLTYDPTAPAATLQVAFTDPDLLATASSAGPPFPTFDGSVAAALANLRTQPAALGGTVSLEESMRAIVSDLGTQTASAQLGASTQRDLVTAADVARMATHGVSVDEELVTLMEYQRMYEAAARTITAVDEALDVLINRTGVVGR